MYLLRSKVTVPRVGRRLVSRPRVLELLADPHARVCVLSAPPGFGKTSAVVDHLEHSGTAAAWLSLDEADNDVARFVPQLVAAVSGDPEALTGLVRGSLAEPVHLAEGVVALLEEPGAPRAVVLDDVHVIRDRAVHAVLEALIARLPDGVVLVLITREDPPLRLSRLRAAGSLVELRADQLRFSETEADAFLRQRMDLALPAPAVQALVRSTEGWPAVLQLAALTLAGQPDAASRALQVSANHRLILDYVTEEVLDRLDAGEVDFLERTCHLERLSGDLCDAVTGRTDGAVMLERLERANLLLVPLDDQRRWYRFHRLFADLLKVRSRWPAAEVHLAAAEWFAAQSLLVEALEQAVRVPDLDRTAELIWLLGSRMLHLGEVPAVRAALAQLPPAAAQSDLGVCLLQAWACVLGGPVVDPAPCLERAATIAARTPAHPLAPILPGMSQMIRALAATDAGRPAEAIELAGAALRDGPPAQVSERHALVYRGDGLTVLGHAYWAAGDVRRAITAYSEALPLLREVGNWLAVAEMVANTARLELRQGRPGAALALCEEHGERQTPADARVLMVRALALREQGRPEAVEVAATALARAKAAGDLATIEEARRMLAGRAAGSLTLPNGATLSTREIEVLKLIADGRSNAEIARRLFLTVGTVKSHAHAIATKLGTANRVEASARARELDLVD